MALTAVADGIVTGTERQDLERVARLLGHDQSSLDVILNEAAATVVNAPIRPASATAESSLAGKSVCFTGEMQCSHKGQVISREYAEQLAMQVGLHPVDSVTKKVDLLVIADPQTQSGKAQKARRYGIRIMHEPVFWKALGVEVT